MRDAQNFTKLTYDGLDFHKRLWIDTSIQNSELNISKVSQYCAEVTKENENTWRKRYYTWKHRLPTFQDLWHETYSEYYRKRLMPKLLSKMCALIDKETDLSKLVRMLEVIENKGQEGRYSTNPLILSEIKPRGFFQTDRLEFVEVQPNYKE